MFLSIVFSLVLSPHNEKHGEVLSTSTDSGSVIIDVVQRVKTPEGMSGVTSHDTGLSYSVL